MSRLRKELALALMAMLGGMAGAVVVASHLPTASTWL